MTEPKSEPRWKQRFNNYLRAFRALDRAVELAEKFSRLYEQAEG